MTPEEKFMSCVDRRSDEECWDWTGPKIGKGYGRFRWEGAAFVASRWAYQHFVGPIPAGMQVDHVCMNKACQNPRHPRLLTPSDNTRHQGRRADNTSGVKGVKRAGPGRWRATVTLPGGRRLHLGMFADPAEAGEVVRAKRIELFGEHLEPKDGCKCGGFTRP